MIFIVKKNKTGIFKKKTDKTKLYFSGNSENPSLANTFELQETSLVVSHCSFCRPVSLSTSV